MDAPGRGFDAGTLDRAHGALAGLALGDALGMPTQSFTRAQVRQRFGLVPGLLEGPPDQPIAPGMPAGSITDDTEQAVLLAQVLVAGGGRVDPRVWATALLDWEAGMVARGSRDLLGPSTSRAVAAIRDGADPREAGSTGTTNGAAMRVAPVGVATTWGPDPRSYVAFLDRVEQVCLPTHHTGPAIAGAAAVGAAVSVGVGGGSLSQALDAAVTAAEQGQVRGRQVPGPSVPVRIRWALDTVRGLDPEEADARLADLVGTTVATVESVPAALALVPAAVADPWSALRRAASLGGDTDTVAAMLGAVTGALLGRSALPPAADRVEAMHGLDLPGLAAGLLDLRTRS